MHDVRRWTEAHASRAPLELPPLVWIAAPHLLRHARIDRDAASIETAERTVELALVERHALNQSWFDASSAQWFAQRDIAARGTLEGARFVARTLWPEDFRFGPRAPPIAALPDAPTPPERLRALIREPHRADAPFTAATLWQRDASASDWRGKPVLAFALNGAQGDDDEAHAGHFSIVTGRIADDGTIAPWLVNNFYSLDVVSEKGTIAAPVTLDNYQADLNAGQSWYRPSWLLVAVLDDDRAIVRVQSALCRVYRQFWRHQLAYYHPTDNCTSIGIDTLRALGLELPLAGPTVGALAPLLLPALWWRERSLREARSGYDYLVSERTRLLPAVATESVFDALWRMAQRTWRSQGTLGREIAEDLAAIAFVRIPQVPSSRAWGTAPVVSLREYFARLPADRAQRKVVPVPERPFPEELRDADLLPVLPHPSDRALRLWRVVPLVALALALVVLGR